MAGTSRSWKRWLSLALRIMPLSLGICECESEPEIDLPAEEEGRLGAVVVVAGVEELAHHVGEDLDAVEAGRILRGEAYREVVARGGQHALEGRAVVVCAAFISLAPTRFNSKSMGRLSALW